MILDRTRTVGYDGQTRDGEPEEFESNDHQRVPVTVVFTTIEGTLAALSAAAQLSRGLGAQIVIQVTEVVSFRYLIQGLRDSMSFFQRLCEAMVTECGLKNVGIEVHLCRDQVQCLQATLTPHSIVVIGTRRCWWPWRERQLERALNRRGFDTLLVQAQSALPQLRSKSVVRRMIDEARATQV